jgi:hypothetical protein
MGWKRFRSVQYTTTVAHPSIMFLIMAFLMIVVIIPVPTDAFRSSSLILPPLHRTAVRILSPSSLLMSSEWNDNANDSNQWAGLSDLMNADTSQGGDWQDMLNARKDGSFWNTFEPSPDKDEDESSATTTTSSKTALSEEDEAEAWLDTLAALSAEEVEFNIKEADRADKVRQMEEWQFTPEVIASTLGVATTTELEKDEVEGMDMYREQSYLDDVDLETVESHTMVRTYSNTYSATTTQSILVSVSNSV